MTMPISGAMTKTASSSDSQIGRPQSTLSCQYMNATIIPTAPCPKLKTPDVV